MICLKNRTFAVSQTASTKKTTMTIELWFAWKIVLLQYHKQRDFIAYYKGFSCDLLEKSYFCSITNSFAPSLTLFNSVVICLKNRTFAVSQTALDAVKKGSEQLWFAWKIVLLQYHKQQDDEGNSYGYSCDLLEKSYFCSITNSNGNGGVWCEWVVICLKNRTFAVSQTAVRKKTYICRVLWFAWKIVLLQYHKQQIQFPPIVFESCDLLEKSYFCSITNSR